MKKWKKEYEQIVVPEALKERMEETMKKASQDKKKVKRNKVIRYAGSAAAVIAIVFILPNTSRTAAAAMQQIPVLGEFFKVVTVREYQVEEDRYIADVKVPEVVPEENEGPVKETTDAINFDIQKTTDELIEEFKQNMEEFEDGYQDLYIDSKVLVNDDKWFSLDLVLYQGAGSGYERHRHYTIDKTTGNRAVLSDFFGDDYVETISECVSVWRKMKMLHTGLTMRTFRSGTLTGLPKTRTSMSMPTDRWSSALTSMRWRRDIWGVWSLLYHNFQP